MTIAETQVFLEAAKGTAYYNLYILALETGIRIGELCGLQWDDIDYENKKLKVNRTLCYFSKDGKYIYETHDTKTVSGQRIIPLTSRAMQALKKQRIKKNEIILKGRNGAFYMMHANHWCKNGVKVKFKN